MKLKVQLEIRSDVLTDSRIAKLMRTSSTPNTLAPRKHRKRWKSHKRGQWKLQLADLHTISEIHGDKSLSKIIRKLLGRVAVENIESVKRADVNSRCLIRVDFWDGVPTCGFSINPDLLREIADMGLVLDITSWIGFGELTAKSVKRRPPD